MVLSSATYAHLTESELKAAELKQMPPTSVKGKSHAFDIYALG
jgi:hypothetical protein